MIAKEYLHNNSSSGLPSGQKRVVNDWSRRRKGKAGQDSLRDELRAVMPAYRDGGSIDWSKVPEGRRRLVSGILSHKDVDWVRRALDKDRETVPDWEKEGNVATHKLSVAGEGTEDNPYYIYAPVMTVDGKLVDTTDPRFGFGKYGNPDWAVERKDTVQVPDLDSGLWFTEHYKDILPFRYGKGGEYTVPEDNTYVERVNPGAGTVIPAVRRQYYFRDLGGSPDTRYEGMTRDEEYEARRRRGVRERANEDVRRFLGGLSKTIGAALAGAGLLYNGGWAGIRLLNGNRASAAGQALARGYRPAAVGMAVKDALDLGSRPDLRNAAEIGVSAALGAVPIYKPAGQAAILLDRGYEAAKSFAEGGRTDNSPEPSALPYEPSLRLLKNLENPRGVGLKNGRYWPYYDGSQAFGLGTDILTNDTGRKLAAKARKEGIPAQQAHDIAVTELRKHDRAIMDSLEEEGYTERPDTISLGPRLLAAQARYQRGNIKPIFKEWVRAVIKGDGKKQKEIIGKYVKGQDRKNKVSTFDVYYGGWRTADDRKGIATKR